jgi:heme-degrading monooxygenase HmoA
MIIREWRGRADPDRADNYPRHFRDVVVSELRGIPGFLGASLSRREQDGRIEFLVLTQWRSMEAIRAFAGSEPGKVLVEPGALAALADFDETVRHYEIIENVVTDQTIRT